jgi:hypothetical protein
LLRGTASSQQGEAMKKVTVSLCFLLIFVLSVPRNILAQPTREQNKGDWAGLKAVPPGDELKVVRKDGKSEKGRLLNSSIDSLTLSKGKKLLEVKREDVQRIYRLMSKSAAKSSAIGAGIGAGTGVVTGAVITAKYGSDSGEEWFPAFVLGLLGAGIGALLGMAAGIGKKAILIYESQ